MEAIQVALLTIQLATAPTAADAAALQYAGDPLAALRIAEQLAAARPDDVAARLLGACAALEAGRFRRAEALLDPLERRAAPPPRAKVLRALLERRMRASDEPFMRALAATWISPRIRRRGTPPRIAPSWLPATPCPGTATSRSRGSSPAARGG
ncbi:MAG TPA: tetratricopeptide repeat protein [Anaeromyxobacteraceae bacterium]|nr:tetratricopeptide repeat protein [Anaeromyxobacteraceae bacterium]